MLYLSLIFLSFYILLLIVVMIGLQKAISKYDDVPPSSSRFISVVLPFRNEEPNLPRIIQALTEQSYNSFEVILINDHSEDHGLTIARDLTQQDSRFRIINSHGIGKKEALTTGIREANGEIIATTDADCNFGHGWLREINEAFENLTVKLAFGPVNVEGGESIFSQLQWMEFLTVTGLGLAAYGLDYPLFCNAANLAFRKDIFVEVDGYQGNAHIPSGDDEFLLKKVRSKYPGGVMMINKADAIVHTIPQPTIRSFLHQRIRWAGKWKLNGDWISGMTAVAMFLIQCFVLISWCLFISDNKTNGVLFFPLAIKILLDYALISTMANSMNRKTPGFVFLLLQLLYPFYVIYIAIFSNFQSFHWKGRRHSY
jgi:poly-beta-1,6-N-acetyl-D-glucosamine synthase